MIFKYELQEFQERIVLLDGLQPFSTYVIQTAVKNYYSDPLEWLPLGKEIWGKTKSGGELWAWDGFLEWYFVIYVTHIYLYIYF